ncbi:excinuclease ABC subunit UvrA [Xylanibacter ruminicola]|uniref:UvrABC system protein A n=1 Tax=Xylanibacter ruminicola TaxID=839 RepID=A0A1M6T9T4_XYLRU|nr:excinuclease ABC subunit UvrA [Xylanibacter ruminicola]SHK53737.1 excinuclease ABC subunit A [Xylanibacter ruminicola]
MKREDDKINVYGARVHNLKNIDVEIPRNSLTVITGLSGSGKSSLAFDTIFAEGQRRYIETFSAYARNFLGSMERPDVDKITGLSPVISIEQKTTNKNPRSTVGTTTEIYDYMRLLFARAGRAYSFATGEEMVRYTEERVLDMITHDYAGHKIYILAPVVRSRKGHYRELFESMRRKGYLHIRVDGQMQEIVQGMKVDRYKNHDIEVVIDRMKVPDTPDEERLKKSISIAMKQGDGLIMILDQDTNQIKHFSKRLMCPTTGISYSDPAPNNFSFNSPQGACPHCKGLGVINQIDLDKVIPDKKLTIREGGIVPLGKYKNQMIFWQVEAILAKFDCNLNTPIGEIPDDAMTELLYGSLEDVRIDKDLVHTSSDYFVSFDGIIKYLRNVIDNDDSSAGQKWADQFLAECECPECHGQRLNREALSYTFGGRNIADLATMDLSDLRAWIAEIEEKGEQGEARDLSENEYKIAKEILKEIKTRLDFLLEVGLDYLSLNRQSASLSGGESQRIRLATQIGSQLVNVLYILDEPSIGLHQRDNERLIRSLKELRDLGNTVIVVEHDEDMMRHADYIVDIGPRAGRKGGEVVFQGTPDDLLKTDTLTAQYLNGMTKIEIGKRRPGSGQSLILKGCTGNNLKHIDAEFPLGKLIVVTGVSGSGKSTLINETLQPILSQHFYRSLKRPMPYKAIEGLEYIDKVVSVDQSPIGRTPRSNPATYTGVFSDIRSLFVNLPEAKIRGYKPGRFSFNVKGGRCETCGGNGYKTIEMNFLPDIQVPCEDCHGKRYNRETLEVRYKGKSIADVLDMTINQAVEFFENVPEILRKIKSIQDVGLGYIKLGQPSTTLSGGESQRIKLATELSKRDTGKTMYILDEPTTGLHFEDIRILMQVLQQLVDRGNTVIIIEHNLDVIKQADWIIDIGPEGGRNGGQILATGTPEQVAKSKRGYTPRFIKEVLKK